MRKPRSLNSVSGIQRFLAGFLADFLVDFLAGCLIDFFTVAPSRQPAGRWWPILRDQRKFHIRTPQKRFSQKRKAGTRPGRLRFELWSEQAPCQASCEASCPRRISLTSTRFASNASRSTG